MGDITPSIGVCLTIGVNHPDHSSPAYSGVGFDDLAGCVIDSHNIAAICLANGFTTVTQLVDEGKTDALPTKANILKAIRSAAESCKGQGGLFVLHFSGHGMLGLPGVGPQMDANGNPISAWLTRDQPLASFELYREWAAFDRYSRIFVLSDSCHSGRAIKAVWPALAAGPIIKPRTIPQLAQVQIAANCPSLFSELHSRAVQPDPQVPIASVLLISGCKTDETSGDTATEGGCFTASVQQVWRGGAFKGDYQDFHVASAVATAKRNRGQNPDIFYIGAGEFEQDMMRFIGQKPFTIGPNPYRWDEATNQWT